MGPDQRAVSDGAAHLQLKWLDESEWWLLRDLRSVALQDAPHAFGSLNGQPESALRPSSESDWTETQWRDTCGTGEWAVARLTTQPVGIARLVDPSDEPPHIESLWTHPAHRRRGVASFLVHGLAARAEREGKKEILVWVIMPNEAALGLYEQAGFERTGEMQQWGEDGMRVEERLRLPMANGLPHPRQPTR